MKTRSLKSTMKITIKEITKLARDHAANLTNDINNASTRIEHIRLTTLAIEAHNLAAQLEELDDHQTSHITEGLKDV